MIKKFFNKLSYVFIFVLIILMSKTNSVYAKVEDYKYEVYPILQNFNTYIYVKTNNLDPNSFRLVDRNSKYIKKEKGHAENIKDSIYNVNRNIYKDVSYENESIYRVKGGYIFKDYKYDEGSSDGGELIIQERIGKYNPNYYEDGQTEGNATTFSPKHAGRWKDTKVKIRLPRLVNYIDYLIENKTSKNKSLFANLDSIERYLNEVSVYPNYFQDDSIRLGYPSLALSPYRELSINTHLENVYKRVEGASFLYASYPFILNSASTPGTFKTIAQRLDSNAKINRGNNHWEIVVSKNGKERTYGGAGRGGNNPIYTSHLEKYYKFDNSKSDFVSKNSLKVLSDKLFELKLKANKDSEKLLDSISGKAYLDTIGNGSWIRVEVEGGISRNIDFTYIHRPYFSKHAFALGNAWVDNRYLDEYERIYKKASFNEYSTADILIKDVTFTNSDNKTITTNVLYEYDKNSGKWIADERYYTGKESYSYPKIRLPEELILTRDEVNALNLGYTETTFPNKGFIYDGSVKPGTPYILKDYYITKYSNIRSVANNSVVKTKRIGDKVQGYIYGDWIHFNENGEELKISRNLITGETPKSIYVLRTSNIRNQFMKIVGTKNKNDLINAVKVGDYYRFYDNGVRLIHKSCVNDPLLEKLEEVYILKAVNIRDRDTNKVIGVLNKGDYVYAYLENNHYYFNYKGSDAKVYSSFVTTEKPVKRWIKLNANVRNQANKIVGVKYKGESISSIKIGDYYRFYDNGVRFIYKTLVSDSPIKTNTYKGYAKFTQNIRDKNENIIGILRLGNEVEGKVLGQRLEITFNGKSGYLYRTNLSNTRTQFEGVAKFTQWIRDYNSNKVSVLPRGAIVRGKIVGQRIEINYRGNKGLVWIQNLD